MADGAGVPDLSDRLNRLFDHVRRPDGTRHSNQSVADALTAAGTHVTAPYLSQLRNGRKTNPAAGLLHALANFFGTSISYFFDEEPEADLSPLESHVAGVLARSHDLSPETRAQLEMLVEFIADLDAKSHKDE